MFLKRITLFICTAWSLTSSAQTPVTLARDYVPHYAVGTAEAFRDEFLQRLNAVRRRGCNCGKFYMRPVGDLTWNFNLQEASWLHAKDMNSRNYFSHTTPEGVTSRDRIYAQGYTIRGYKYVAVGENIAKGQLTIQEVVDDWLNSEGHCRNIMNPNFMEVGISKQGDYWVQEFGGRRR